MHNTSQCILPVPAFNACYQYLRSMHGTSTCGQCMLHSTCVQCILPIPRTALPLHDTGRLQHPKLCALTLVDEGTIMHFWLLLTPQALSSNLGAEAHDHSTGATSANSGQLCRSPVQHSSSSLRYAGMASYGRYGIVAGVDVASLYSGNLSSRSSTNDTKRK